MTTFDDREKGFEAKYALDAEQEFKAVARRNKLLGLWAAEKMGLSADSADQYASAVVKADFEQPGEEDVFRKIAQDLEGSGIAVTEGRSAPQDGRAVLRRPRADPQRRIGRHRRYEKRAAPFPGRPFLLSGEDG
jgi:hypothetical protein